MKITIFFALASASICWGFDIPAPPAPPVWLPPAGLPSNGYPSYCLPSSSGQPPYSTFRCDSPYRNSYATDKDCLKNALEKVPKLAISANVLICKHYCNQGAVGAAAGDVFAEVFPTIAEIIHHTPLSGEVLDIVCILFSNFLTSECVKQITDNVNLLIDDLKILSCQRRQKKLDPQILVKILGNAGCLTDNLLHTGDLLENLTEVVGNILAPVLATVADSVLNLPVVGEVLGTVTCLLNNLLGGVLGILGPAGPSSGGYPGSLSNSGGRG
ncbi:uncharacterized protein [Phyllobates terribilis]|uniref:uncharacterized protein isoform X2 n=1 Tax=Phyllobates terribilis TaxID=111132 RepID=UPI003CCADCB8